MGLLRPIEDDLKSMAKITETADLREEHERLLGEQRSKLESEHAKALEEQKRRLQRDHDNALQMQKQQFESERDSALQKQKELQAKDVAESSLRKEVEDQDVILQELLDRVIRVGQYFGFELPEDVELSRKVELLALYGKPYISIIYRAAFEELSRRLSISIGQWPSFENLLPQEHNNQVTSFLTSQVDSIVKTCDARVKAEQRRTFNVRYAWINAKMDVIEKATIRIRGLQAQSREKDEILIKATDLLDAHFGDGKTFDIMIKNATEMEAALVEKHNQVVTFTERLNWHIDALDDTDATLERMAALATVLVEKMEKMN